MDKQKLGGIVIIVLLVSLLMFGCQWSATPQTEPVMQPTQTPTAAAGDVLLTEEESNRCAGLSGTLELHVLVGPSEIVGMAPLAIGKIPFTVNLVDGRHVIEGGGPLYFEEQVYELERGTYSVSFDGDGDVSGTCEALDQGEVLNLTVVMVGEQMLTVITEGFQMDYPWSGTVVIEASLPVEEGAEQSGEGWTLVLHFAR
jgi:hypothetical protein